jgi:hypothetical protein
MSLYSESGLELYLLLTWLKNDVIHYTFALCQVNKGICSSISSNELWKNLFEIRFRNTSAFLQMMSYNSYFDASIGHEWRDAYKIVFIDVIRDKKWLKSDKQKNISVECNEINIDYIDEVGGLCGGNIVCTTTEDDKSLIAIDSQNGAIIRRISIMPERGSPKKINVIKAVDDKNILLLSPITSTSVILLDASTFEIVQTFSVIETFQDLTKNSDLYVDGNSLQICDCLMDAQYIVASVFYCNSEGDPISGLYLLTWDRQSGEYQSFIMLTYTTPQDYVMAIYKGFVRLIIQKPEPFEVPWKDTDKVLEKGQWLLSIGIFLYLCLIGCSLRFTCRG